MRRTGGREKRGRGTEEEEKKRRGLWEMKKFEKFRIGG